MNSIHLFNRLILILILAGFTALPAKAQEIIYVDSAATGANNGTDWANAFTDLRDALATASNGIQVWVARGTYYPGTNRGDSFVINQEGEGIKLYGSFAGNETDFSQRNLAENETILSGDIGTPGDNSDNSYHVVHAVRGPGGNDVPISSTTIIDGFTITGGNANAATFPDNSGGGLFCEAATRCVPKLRNIIFSNNSAGDRGGGMFHQGGTDILNNLTLTNVIFSNNSAGERGGGMFNDGTGENWESKPILINVGFFNNSAEGHGGGMYNDGADGKSIPTLINVTFSGNSASSGGGIVNNGLNSGIASPTLTNVILWGNTASNRGAQMHNISATPSLDFCVVEGGADGIGESGSNSVDYGENNIEDDPLFADEASSDFRLTANSPAINAGSNTPFETGGDAETVATDLNGHARIQGSTVDIGAYEFKGNLLAGSGLSLQLNGTGQYADLSAVAPAMTGKQDNWSVMFWMKADQTAQSDPDGGQVALFSIHSSSNENKLILFMGQGGTQNGDLTVYDGTDADYEITNTATVGDNEWRHVAYVGTGGTGGTATLYIDGIKRGGHSPAYAFSSDDQWSLGQEHDGSPSDFLKGLLDQVSVWDQVLSVEEIRRYMFHPLQGNEPNLQAYWDMEWNGTSSIFDKSAHGRHADVINAPSFSSETPPFGTWITGEEGWRMMASPFGGGDDYFSGLLESLWTQGATDADITGGTPNIYTWNEGNGAQDTTSRGFAAQPTLKDAAPLQNNYGFIIYVFEDDDPDNPGIDGGFPKMIRFNGTHKTGDQILPVTLTKEGGNYEQGRDGWNLVANPYGTTINWSAGGWTKTNIDNVVYVWSDSASGGAGAYLTWSSGGGTLTDGLIAPWQGFWVKANDTGTPALSLTDAARDTGGVFYKRQPVPQIQFELEGSQIHSKAVVMFHEQGEAGKDPLDAWKLQSLNADHYLSLYTTTPEGHALDINVLPQKIEQPLEFTMHFEGSDLGGRYTLSWNPKELPKAWPQGAVMLTDLYTDRIINLSQAGEYTFEVKAAKAKGSGVQPPPNHGGVKGKTSKGSEPLEVSIPGHGPLPTVIKAKASNPRFLLTINPAGSTHKLAGIPEQLELRQNYPNPFNPETIIRYGVPEQSTVQLTVFDILGRKVATLLNEEKNPGRYQLNFDASRLASGLYIYRLKVGGNVLTRKMMLIK